MQLYAFLDPEFWLIMLRELWPVVAVPIVLGFAAGIVLGKKLWKRP